MIDCFVPKKIQHHFMNHSSFLNATIQFIKLKRTMLSYPYMYLHRNRYSFVLIIILQLLFAFAIESL